MREPVRKRIFEIVESCIVVWRAVGIHTYYPYLPSNMAAERGVGTPHGDPLPAEGQDDREDLSTKTSEAFEFLRRNLLLEGQRPTRDEKNSNFLLNNEHNQAGIKYDQESEKDEQVVIDEGQVVEKPDMFGANYFQHLFEQNASEPDGDDLSDEEWERFCTDVFRPDGEDEEDEEKTEDNIITFFFQEPFGTNTLAVRCEPGCRGIFLKQLVAHRLGVEGDDFKDNCFILMAGRPLEDEDLLGDFGLDLHRRAIQVVFKARGGAPPVFTIQNVQSPPELSGQLNSMVNFMTEMRNELVAQLAAVTSQLELVKGETDKSFRGVQVAIGDLGGATVADRVKPMEVEVQTQGQTLTELKEQSNKFAKEVYEEIREKNDDLRDYVNDESANFARGLASKDVLLEARLSSLESALATSTDEHRSSTEALRQETAKLASGAVAAFGDERAQLLQVAQGLEKQTCDAMRVLYEDLKVRLEAVASATAGVASAQQEQHQQQQQQQQLHGAALEQHQRQLQGAAPQPDPLQTSDAWRAYNAGRVSAGSAPIPSSGGVPLSPGAPHTPAATAAAAAACTAAAAAAAATPQQPMNRNMPHPAGVPPGLPFVPPRGPGGYSPSAVAAIPVFRLSAKDWGQQAKLDLAKPTAYVNWYDQALDYLAPPARPDIRALLKWAEVQQNPIDHQREVEGVQELAVKGIHLVEGVAGVSFISDSLLAGLRTIIHDNLLGRARAAGRGLELWRKLRSEARGSAPALAAVKAQQWSHPRQSTSMANLWNDLDEWILLGQEVEEGSLHSMSRPPWLKLQALKQLIPSNLETQLKLQMPDADYEQALAWVRRQMEFHRGDTQASSFSRHGEKSINEVTTELESTKAQLDEMAWYLYNGDEEAINAIRKGKGGKGGKGGVRKGKGAGGGGRKGGSSGPLLGGSPRKPPGKGAGIKGNCWECGEQGHRADQCPKKKGVNEVTGEGQDGGGGGEAITEAAAEEAAAAQAWFGTAPAWNLLGSISVEAPPSPSPSPSPAVAWQPSLRAAAPRSRQPQPQLLTPPGLTGQQQQPLFHQHLAAEPAGSWPLPAAAAAIQSPSTRAAKDFEQQPPQLKSNAPRPKRTWNRIQAVWEEIDERRGEDGLLAAALRETTSPQAAPPGMRVVRIDATIDSGAEAIVAPKGLLPGALVPSSMSRAGRAYRAANGSRIANFGQTEATFRTGDGHSCKLLFQVADVERVLVGVSPLTQSGHEVKMGKDGGEILHVASGRTIALQRRGGVFYLPMYFLTPEGESGASLASDFPRQGA